MLTLLDPHSAAISKCNQGNKEAIHDGASMQMGQFMQQIVASFVFSLILATDPLRALHQEESRVWFDS